MLVRSSKYKELLEEYEICRETLRIYERRCFALYVRLLNKEKSPNFSKGDIDSLIRLCHPDKHNNSEASTRMTQKLLDMRGKLR